MTTNNLKVLEHLLFLLRQFFELRIRLFLEMVPFIKVGHIKGVLNIWLPWRRDLLLGEGLPIQFLEPRMTLNVVGGTSKAS